MARATVGLVLLTLGISLIAATDSRGAFPGENGRIVFADYGGMLGWAGDPPGLYLVEPDGSALRPLKQGLDGSSFSHPAWSPDGSKIAYVHNDPTPRIEVMNADGSDERVVVPPAPTQFTTPIQEPAWSPDGSLIAFTRAGELWIVGADGRGARRIVGGVARSVWSADWSPDCSRIAFGVFEARAFEIRTVDAYGGERSVVDGFGPDWSPDGRHLVFYEERSPGWVPAIRVIGADGAGERLLAIGREPAWSPDGREVVYTKWGRSLMATPAEGGAPRILTAHPDGQHWESDWQPLRKTPLESNLCAAWRDPGPSSLELSVRPRRAVVGRATRFRLRVTGPSERGSEAVPEAVVRFAGQRRSTDARGRTDVLHTFRRPGKRQLTAEEPGFSPARTTLRIVEWRQSRGRMANTP